MSLSPVFVSKTNHPLRVYCVGHEPKRFDWPEAKSDLIRLLGEDPGDAMLVVLAPTCTDVGFGTIKRTVFNSVVHADGIYYDGDESAVFMCQTADCPLLIIQNDETGKIAFGHCGKSAMRGHNGMCGNMVTTVLSHFKDVETVHLSAYIVAGICGRCYTHEQDLSQVTPFYRLVDHGEDRVQGELNLIRRIKHELRHHDIPESNIEIDWRCTKETPGLSSHRSGDTTRNTIIIAAN